MLRDQLWQAIHSKRAKIVIYRHGAIEFKSLHGRETRTIRETETFVTGAREDFPSSGFVLMTNYKHVSNVRTQELLS